MNIFSADVNEQNGRAGLLEIDGNKIVTPTYAPTKNEFVSLTNSSLVSKKDYKDAKIGEYVCWLDSTQLWALTHKAGAYNSKKAAFKSELENINAKTKIIHFNFFEDVTTIDADQLEVLLDLQNDSGADVIQIPNIATKYDYNKAIEKTHVWKTGKGVNKPLMGVISKRSDLDLLKTKLSTIDSIGVNLSPYNQPLLIGIKNELKSKNIWIHGISAPITYPKSKGTLGILVNYYGIDTISTPVMNWKSAQGYGGRVAKMSEDEQSKNALKNKYFKPTDYETPTFDLLQKNFGEGHKLSAFCNCPICRSLTIKGILEKPMTVNDNSRSHRVISFLSEGATYQGKLKNNETDAYIASKTHAKMIIG
jgi:hypothetical protein